MFLAQLCLEPLMCRSEHLCSGKGARGGGCCLSPGVVRAQRKRMLDPLGPAQLFEVTSGWWPAVSTCRALQESVCSRQMCHSAATMDTCPVDRAPRHSWHPSFPVEPEICDTPGDPAVKPPLGQCWGILMGRFFLKCVLNTLLKQCLC